MAKVIGHTDIKENRYKATCSHCGAVIIFEEDEVREDTQYNEYCFSYAPCPECGKNVTFDKRKDKVKGCPDSCNHQKNGYGI